MYLYILSQISDAFAQTAIIFSITKILDFYVLIGTMEKKLESPAYQEAGDSNFLGYGR
jgi:hypothetical protein